MIQFNFKWDDGRFEPIMQEGLHFVFADNVNDMLCLVKKVKIYRIQVVIIECRFTEC